MRWWMIGCAVFWCAGAQARTTILYKNFSDVSAFSFAGNAAGAAADEHKAVIRLAPAVAYQSGAAYLTAPIVLGPNGSFKSSFQFQVSGTASTDWADGMTFVLAASPAALGGSGAYGGGLGYLGTPNSLAVEFDTYLNDGYDALPNEVAVVTGGNVYTVNNPAGSVGQPYGMGNCFTAGAAPAGCLNDGKVWTAVVTYDGTYLNVEVQDGRAAPVTVIANYPVNLVQAVGSRTVYAGFTAGTGSYEANFYVTYWKFEY